MGRRPSESKRPDSEVMNRSPGELYVLIKTNFLGKRDTLFPRIVSANTINFSFLPYSNTKQGRILKLWHMLTAPMEPCSSLFGPHPCLGQQKDRYQSLCKLPAIFSGDLRGSISTDPTLLRSNIPHMRGSAKTIQGRVLIHSL